MRGHAKTILSVAICLSLMLTPVIALGLVAWQTYDPAEGNAVHAEGFMAKLELDSIDNPHIVWINDGKLLYSHLTENGWVCADGEPYSADHAVVTTGTVADASLTLDSNGTQHITWQSYERKKMTNICSLNYATWDDKWVNIEGEPGDFTVFSNEYSSRHSIALSSEDAPTIVWCDMLGVSLIRLADEGWINHDGEVFDTDDPESALLFKTTTYVGFPSLAFDSKDNPRFTWQQKIHHEGFGDWDVMYCAWDGDKWVDGNGDEFDPVDSGVGIPAYSFMVLNSQLSTDIGDIDHLTFSYIGFGPMGTESNVVYLKSIGDGWTCADDTPYNPLDKSINNPARITSDGMSSFQLIAVDDGGRPHITWGSRDGDIEDVSDTLYVMNEAGRWLCVDGTEFNDSMPMDTNPANVSHNNSHTYPSSIAVDSDGNPHIVWVDMMSAESDVTRQIVYVRWNGEEWVTPTSE